jgi:hypothetical protein
LDKTKISFPCQELNNASVVSLCIYLGLNT